MYTRYKKGGLIVRRVQAIVALMASGVFLLAGVSGSSAAVLCKGADGHVKVEAATQGVCTSDTERSSERSAAGVPAYRAPHRGDHCGPCVDLPLGNEAGKETGMLAQATRTEVKVPIVSIFLEVSAPTAARVSHFARGSDGFLASPMLVSLRTVTLLI